MLFINDLWFKHLMLAIEEEQEEEEWKEQEQEDKQEVRTRRKVKQEKRVLDLIFKSNSRWIFVYVFLCSVRLTYNLI